MIGTLNLRCYLMVALCVISPDFATCSLALHKHVVNIVVKRLSTFASLALSAYVFCSISSKPTKFHKRCTIVVSSIFTRRCQPEIYLSYATVDQTKEFQSHMLLVRTPVWDIFIPEIIPKMYLFPKKNWTLGPIFFLILSL